jgi:hypothetical protein
VTLGRQIHDKLNWACVQAARGCYGLWSEQENLQDIRGERQSMNGLHDPNPTPLARREWWPELSGRIFQALFRRHPFVNSVITMYGPMALIGYSVLAFVAGTRKFSWFEEWLDLWLPLARGLRNALPFLDSFARSLVADGFAFREKVVGHVLMFSVIVCALLFVFGVIAILSRKADDWTRLAEAIPLRRLVYNLAMTALLFAVCAALPAIWFAVGGEPFDLDALLIPVLCYSGMFFGLSLLVTAGAMCRGG